MEDPSQALSTAIRMIRAGPGWTTSELAEALNVHEDLLYVALYRLGRSQGITLSALYGWVPVDDPRVADLCEADTPPCPEPTEAQLEAAASSLRRQRRGPAAG